MVRDWLRQRWLGVPLGAESERVRISSDPGLGLPEAEGYLVTQWDEQGHSVSKLYSRRRWGFHFFKRRR